MAESATKWTCGAPRWLRVARTSEGPTRRAPVAATSSAAIVKSAITRTMPRSLRFGLRGIGVLRDLEVHERAVPDRHFALGDGADRGAYPRIRVRQVGLDRDANRSEERRVGKECGSR